MDMEADGQGRSKRDAKPLAASKFIKRIRLEYTDIDNIKPVQNSEALTTDDIIVRLHDYCVQNDIPLPSFEIVQQGGTPEEPEYIAICSVASIKRYGVADKKKEAKQIAAYQILQVIYNDYKPLEDEMQVTTVDATNEDVEAERFREFKTYRELTESQLGTDPPGILLCDRHNYFTKFHDHLKTAAKKILNDRSYELDYETQVMDLFRALKITPRFTKSVGVKTIEQLVHIDTNCNYDVVFCDVATKIHLNVLNYFRDMID